MRLPTTQSGLSLIEILIYAGLLATMGVVLTLFATQVIRRNSHTYLASQTLDNARGALSAMTLEVRRANDFYTPTSVFTSNPGQLSLATAENLPADENETYVDFYLENDQLYRKREGEGPEALTSERVRITNLTFIYVNQSANAPGVQIHLTAEPVASTEAIAQSAVSLTTTASLRSY